MLGGADNPNGELLSYIIGADKLSVPDSYPCPAHDHTLSREVSILNQ
ncbi:hypothetical protein ECDEC13D_1477 [Escherichia coli DEC13D]|nr:hypothetical protein [Escherichia coli]EHX66505.1 hypothetical protein ECDEC13D_1477 [Escherichia coli DEC13D]EHX78331.1 hypothetical protein ECDEC13E_0782 [Escherichia coli DEC13E]